MCLLARSGPQLIQYVKYTFTLYSTQRERDSFEMVFNKKNAIISKHYPFNVSGRRMGDTARLVCIVL